MSRERRVILPDTQSPEFNPRVKEAIEVLMGTHVNTSQGRRAPTMNELNDCAPKSTISGYVTFENLSANGDVGTGADQVAAGSRGVTNGDSHDHAGGDGAQIDHGGLGGLSDDDHTQYIKHALVTAEKDFLIASASGVVVKKTLAETQAVLGLGTAAYTAATDYAVAAKGVTNGDSHDHAGGDGAQIDHGGLGGLSDDDHTQYIKHSLSASANDFLVASGSGTFVKKTLAETKTILNLPGLVDRGDPSDNDFVKADLTTDGTWRDLDLSSIVPSGAIAAVMRVRIQDDATESYIQFRKNGNSNSYNSPVVRTQAVGVNNDGNLTVFLDENRVVEYRASNVTFTYIGIVICGWFI